MASRWRFPLFRRGLLRAGDSKAAVAEVGELTAGIPAALPQRAYGDAVRRFVFRTMDRHQRERRDSGSTPGRQSARLSEKAGPGQAQLPVAEREDLAATIFVMPEYLAIGSDSDFLRIPMNLHTATAVADRFGFVLPTKKMVDAIYDQSTFSLHAATVAGRSANDIHRILPDAQCDDRPAISSPRLSVGRAGFRP